MKTYYEVRNRNFQVRRKFYKFHKMISFLRRVGICDIQVIRYGKKIPYLGSFRKTKNGITVRF